ncbi:HlyD family secretion protein [Sphingomonas oryzagri]
MYISPAPSETAEGAPEAAAAEKDKLSLLSQITNQRSLGEITRTQGFHDLAQINRQIDLKNEQIQEKRLALSLAKEQVSDVQAIYQRGFISKMEYNNRKVNVMNAQAELDQLEADKSNLLSSLDHSRLAITSGKVSSSIQNAQTFLAISGLDQRIAKIRRGQRLQVDAPVDGYLTAAVSQVGTYVSTGDALITVAPANTRYIVDLYISPSDMQNVGLNSKVWLQLDADPDNIKHRIEAKIQEISGVLVWPQDEPEKTSFSRPSYRVRAELLNAPLELALRPGMTGHALVIAGHTSLLSKILRGYGR